MPLSKERMRERKKQDRNVKPEREIVKPKLSDIRAIVQDVEKNPGTIYHQDNQTGEIFRFSPPHNGLQYGIKVELDADGEIIPEEI